MIKINFTSKVLLKVISAAVLACLLATSLPVQALALQRPLVTQQGAQLSEYNAAVQAVEPFTEEAVSRQISQLEHMARKGQLQEEADSIIQELIKLGTERADVQKAIVLYSRLRDKKIPDLFINYHIGGWPHIIESNQGVFFGTDKDNSFDDFFKGKSVMMIETHPDDIIINVGCIAKRLMTGASAKRTVFVTAIPDQAGVDDEFVEKIGRLELPPGMDPNDKRAIKRWVRAKEAKHGAELLGVREGDYVNLDLDLPVEQPQNDDNGRLLSYESIFKEPTPHDQKKMDELIRNNDTDIYFCVFPFSNHPQHRVVTKMFLEAIYKYNKKAAVFFWLDDDEFKQHLPDQNFNYYFGNKNNDDKEEAIAQAYVSQNTRRGGIFYSERARLNGQNTADSGYDKLCTLHMYDCGCHEPLTKHLFPFAERMLMVDIVSADKTGNGAEKQPYFNEDDRVIDILKSFFFEIDKISIFEIKFLRDEDFLLKLKEHIKDFIQRAKEDEVLRKKLNNVLGENWECIFQAYLDPRSIPDNPTMEIKKAVVQAFIRGLKNVKVDYLDRRINVFSTWYVMQCIKLGKHDISDFIDLLMYVQKLRHNHIYRFEIDFSSNVKYIEDTALYILGEIGDISAIPALIKHGGFVNKGYDDVLSKALIKMGKNALTELIAAFNSENSLTYGSHCRAVYIAEIIFNLSSTDDSIRRTLENKYSEEWERLIKMLISIFSNDVRSENADFVANKLLDMSVHDVLIRKLLEQELGDKWMGILAAKVPGHKIDTQVGAQFKGKYSSLKNLVSKLEADLKFNSVVYRGIYNNHCVLADLVSMDEINALIDTICKIGDMETVSLLIKCTAFLHDTRITDNIKIQEAIDLAVAKIREKFNPTAMTQTDQSL